MSRPSALLTLLTLLLVPCASAAQGAETLREVRVHGNHTTPDAEIIALAGLTVDAPITDAVLREAGARLRQSGRFDEVEVRKRYRSIDDPGSVLVVVLVNEVAGITSDDLTPGPFKRLRSLGMWLPVLDYADGYGLTYGARVSFVDTLGKGSRISVPLTWGGERRASIEVERRFRRGPLSRLEGIGSVTRRVNPHFDLAERRQELGARAERALSSWLRVGGGARVTKVTFAQLQETYLAPSLDLVVDTRIDPVFPRNAIHTTVGAEQLRFEDHVNIARWHADVRGYVGLFGSSVLALRALTIRASDPLPPYEQPLLGGVSTLRGYEFGDRAGDNLAALSAELRVPLTSPLSVGRLGIKAFVDAGTTFGAGERLSDQRFDRGVGGGVFLTLAVVRAGLDIAWPLGTDERSPRVHFGLGVTF